MTKINKDMVISDVLQMDRDTAPILLGHGLHCLGCVMASGETLEQACAVHGMDCDSLIKDLNEYFESKES